MTSPEATSFVPAGRPDGHPSAAPPFRVLHVLPHAAGGAAISTATLMRELARHGVESSVIVAPGGDPAVADELDAATAGRVRRCHLYDWMTRPRALSWERPLIEMRQQYRTRGRLHSVRGVASAIEDFEADLVASQTVLSPDGAAAAQRLGTPHIWHVRELLGAGAPHRIRRTRRTIRKVVSDTGSLLLANSHTTAARLQSLSPDRLQVRIVGNAVDVEPFLGLEPRTGGALVVGMVANLSARWKRHDLFVRMASCIDAPSVRFHVYGRPPHGSPGSRAYWHELRRLVQRTGVGDRLSFRGYVDPVTAMSELDVLVHPSPGESFGRAVAEGMAAGRPVVVSSRGAASELVDHGASGLVVPSQEPVAFARAVSELLDDAGLRADLGAAGRDRVRATLDLDEHVTTVLSSYREALDLR